MWNRILAVCALAAMSSLAVIANADDAATRKELDEAYGKLKQAYIARDVKAIMKMTTPDFTMKMPGAPPRARKPAQGQFQQMLSHASSVSVPLLQIDKLTPGGNEVSATVKYKIETVSGAGSQSHKLTDFGVTRDVWVKSGPVWALKSMEYISQSVLVDGQKVSIEAVSVSAGAALGSRKKN